MEVGGKLLRFAAAKAVTMPALVAGTDYAVWVAQDGAVQASSNFVAAPGAGVWRLVGGFHYAPGGNAAARAGGDTVPAINEFSLWDAKWRPACADPRGMALVAGGFWADIYLCGVNHHLNGTSKFNVTIADGASLPKVPLAFGGDVSNAINPPSGCRFHPRCSHAMPECSVKEPPLREIGDGHFVACHLVKE